MATKRTRKQINEALKPVKGSKKGPVSPEMQKKLDAEEAAEKKAMKKESVDKFQQMLEYLVNEDTARAEDLFHEIVVEKSRQIYENLLAEELEDEEVDESDDEEVDESDDEEVDESDDEEVDESDDEEVDENFNLDEFEVEADDDMEMGGDPMDDMEMDMDDEEEGDMDMDADMDNDEPVTQDDIKDLEAELADLKAEFEQLMAGEEGDMDMGDEEEGDMDMDDEEEGDMDMGDEEEGDMDMDDEEPEEESFAYESQKKSNAELMREYVNKIGGNEYQQFGKMGDNGANTKSVVAGKNDMGGTTQNILRADTEAGVEANKGNLHGNPVSDQNKKDMNTKNVNVPGAKSATKMTAVPKGHGAEKKGSGDTAANKKSIVGSR